MIARGSRRAGARAAALLTVLAVTCATVAGAAATAGAQSSKLLGTKNVAKGTPVKIGVISNGKTPTVDQSDETPVAQATAQWVNQYQGGLNGHPIQLSICDDHGTASEASDCANKMIQDK